MFVTSLVQTKLCLSQTIPHCKGEQNYGGVTLFVRTDICLVQDQMTVHQTLILTLKVTFHMLLVTHVHVMSKYGVTSNKKHAMFSFGYKILFC